MDKCPKCGYKFKKENYCSCQKLTIWDLVSVNGAEYCKRCEKEIPYVRVMIALSRT